MKDIHVGSTKTEKNSRNGIEFHQSKLQDSTGKVMKIIFAGTPTFASKALEKLIKAGHEISLVLSQPDRPSGRGRKLKASEVKEVALQNGIPVVTPVSLSLKKNFEEASEVRRVMKGKSADVLVVAAYGLIIPQDVLDIPNGIVRDGFPPVKAINIHGSILPRWRGAAPIARGIEKGDKEVGITIMEMDAGLDTGDMLYKKAITLKGCETAGEMTEVLADLGGDMIVEYLRDPSRYPPISQPEEGVTYASKLGKEESPIHFDDCAEKIVSKVLAFNPFPGTTFSYNGQQLKLWRAKVSTMTTDKAPGTVVTVSKKSLAVACGQGTVMEMTELQRPGGKALPVGQFLAGMHIQEGEQLL